jgi:hypothetical protein
MKREVDEKERSRLERLYRVMSHPYIGPRIRAVISKKYHEKRVTKGDSQHDDNKELADGRSVRVFGNCPGKAD